MWVVPIVVALAILVVAICVFAKTARIAQAFERDGMLMGGFDKRLRHLEAKTKHLSPSGELPILGGLDPNDRRINWRPAMVDGGQH